MVLHNRHVLERLANGENIEMAFDATSPYSSVHILTNASSSVWLKRDKVSNMAFFSFLNLDVLLALFG